MKTIRIITVLLFILALAGYAGVVYRYEYALDRTPPQIRCPEEPLEISAAAGETAMLAGVAASDDRDGDLTDQVMIQGVSRLLTADTARITYVVFDSAGNMASCTRTVRYTDYERPIISLTSAPVFKPYPDGDSLKELDALLTAADVRDGDISDQIRITAQNVTDTQVGAYRVNAQIINSMGDSETIPLTIVIDREGAEDPLVKLRQYITYVRSGSPFDPAAYISEVQGRPYSSEDPSLTIVSDVDTSAPGYYQVCYRCQTSERIYTVYMTVVVR